MKRIMCLISQSYICKKGNYVGNFTTFVIALNVDLIVTLLMRDSSFWGSRISIHEFQMNSQNAFTKCEHIYNIY